MTSPAIDPTKLSVADVAKLLTKAGGVAIDAARIRQDVAAGAPTNPDGTLHLVHYTAWLVAQAN